MLTLFTLRDKGEKVYKFFFMITILACSLYAISSINVAKRSYDIMSGYGSSVSQTTMILKNRIGEENIRKLKIKKLENKNGDKSLIDFLYPLDIKDTKLLSYENIGYDDKQWLYMPALKRVKRISSRNKSGAFMSSEFSYEDISSQNYKNYTYEGEALNITIDDKNYYKITRIPKDKNSGYSKQILYIDTKTFLASHGEYFDKQNRLLKKVEFTEYINIEGIYRIKQIKMNNIQNKKSSILIWNDDKIKQKLKNNIFSKRALK